MRYQQFFAGEYQIEKILERSQYSMLGLGKEAATGRQVLLKVWLTARFDSEDAKKRVHEEVETLQKIKHPFLLPLLGAQIDAQKVFLISEYPSAGSLNEQLGQGEEAILLDEALQIIEETGLALQELHTRGITHGNLTPQAVFFNATGQVQVGELLIHTVLDNIQDYQPALDEEIPRCLYMAPEQFQGTVDPQTDQYALGCLAYVLLTGRVPFAGSTHAIVLQKHLRDEPQDLTAINPTLPTHIETAVLKALAKDPGERHRDVEAFLEALDIPGNKTLADQNTMKQVIPNTLLENTGTASRAWEWINAVEMEDANPTQVVETNIDQALTVQFPVKALVPVQAARVAQKRKPYVLIPVALLILVLFSAAGKWFFFPGQSSSSQPQAQGTTKNGSGNTTQTAVLLTPVTATSTQARGTVVAVQVVTPTPTPTVQLTPTVSLAPVQVPLGAFFNNKGLGTSPGQANFDGSGYSYPAGQLPTSSPTTVQGVPYLFPGNTPGHNDNVSAAGQTIPLKQGNYQQVLLLASSSWGPVSGILTIHYTDGSTAAVNVTVLDWYNGSTNGLSTNSRYTSNGIDQHTVNIYVVPVALDPKRVVKALTLPGVQSNGRIHVFAMTLVH